MLLGGRGRICWKVGSLFGRDGEYSSDHFWVWYFIPTQTLHVFKHERTPTGQTLPAIELKFDWRFVALSHNTVRGAAGGAILTAELLRSEGYLAPK